MRNKRLVGFLLIVGASLSACQLGQAQTATMEATSIAQKTETPPPEVTSASSEVASTSPEVTSTSIVSETIPITAGPQFKVTAGFELQIPRTMHTATLLPSGKILVVGGSLEPDDFVADEELIDPTTGANNWTSPLHTSRVGHTATLLPDGRVLVVGGYSLPQRWLSDAEIYDPSSDTWTVISPHYSHGTGHTATLMKDGRVLVVGGCIGDGGCTNRVEIFDPQTNIWIEAAALESDRASPTAQLLDDGRVLIAGGSQADGAPPADGTAVIYDSQTNLWNATEPMITPRYFAESVKLPNGQVLIAGGVIINSSPLKISSSVEIYDPDSNTWKAAPDLTQARYAFVLMVLNGKIMAVGGARDWDCCWTENSFVREIELYDPAANQWYVVGDHPQPTAFATGILLPDERVWVAGGQYGYSGVAFPPETWLISALNP